MGQKKPKRHVKEFWNRREWNSLQYMYSVRHPVTVVRNFLFVWLARFCPFHRIKVWMYRLIGIKLGRRNSIGLHVMMDIFFPELIEMGNNNIIGFDTLILTHEFLQDRWRKGKVTIGNNVMIGARCLIMPGVRIGDDARVASYSLVNRDVGPGELVGGIPAKKIRQVTE